ncbi:hypothetical protein [Methylobacterium fujisawaense]|jgi:hypothetical protein
MRWAIIHHQQVLYRGTREQVLDAAERFDLICHTVPGVPQPLQGRGFYTDGAEIPPRLRQGAVMMPEDMLPARHRRRAA